MLGITTFGTSEAKISEYEIVTLSFATDKETFDISAVVSPVITPPISMKLKPEWLDSPQLKSLKLADPVNKGENLRVDVIIGSDYYGLYIPYGRSDQMRQWTTGCSHGTMACVVCRH